MPFRSAAQRGYLFAHHPQIAHEFASQTAPHAALPMHAGSVGAPQVHPMHSSTAPMGHAAPAAMTAQVPSGWLGMKTGQQLHQQTGGM